MPLEKCDVCGISYLQGDFLHDHEKEKILNLYLPLPWWLHGMRNRLMKHHGIIPLAHEDEEDC